MQVKYTVLLTHARTLALTHSFPPTHSPAIAPHSLTDSLARLLRPLAPSSDHNLTLQPTLESLRQETQYHHDAALALEREWPAVQAGMRGAYQVRRGDSHASF